MPSRKREHKIEHNQLCVMRCGEVWCGVVSWSCVYLSMIYLIKEVLELFIGQVDTKLLKSVNAEMLKPKDIKNTYSKITSKSQRQISGSDSLPSGAPHHSHTNRAGALAEK